MKTAAMESIGKAGLKEWIGLCVLALPALLVSIDVSVMILALPHIGIGLDADGIQQLWIMDIYGFMLSGFLITMGTLGDRVGRSNKPYVEIKQGRIMQRNESNKMTDVLKNPLILKGFFSFGSISLPVRSQ